MTGKVFIDNVGLAKVGRRYESDLISLVDEALADLESRGGFCTEPEAVVVASAYSGVLNDQLLVADHIASWLGLTPRPVLRVEEGHGSGGAALKTAYSLIASGLYRSVLLVGVEKLTDHPSWVLSWVDTLHNDQGYEGYYGMGLAAAWAMVARAYMEEFGVTRRQLSIWPSMMHENARSNPYAALRNPLRPEDVEKSPVLAEPLHVFDAGPASDGAAVVHLVSSDACKRDVVVSAVAAASDYTSLSLRPVIDEARAVRAAYERLAKTRGIDATRIDVIELRDIYSITALLVIEALGLAEKGRAAALLEEGRFRPGDKPVLNPSGGTKARGEVGGATGVYQVAEAFLQLTGSFPGVRVDGAERALVVDLGGVASNATVALLERV